MSTADCADMDRKSLASLAWIRTQSALHEKAIQFTLIGLALTLAATQPAPGIRDFDLLAFCVVPLCALLGQAARRLLADVPGRAVVLACVICQALLFAGAAQCLRFHRFWPGVACLVFFALQSSLLDLALARWVRGQGQAGALDRFHAWQRLLVPVGIAVGTLMTGEVFGLLAEGCSGWKAGALILHGLLALSLVQVIPAIRVRPVPAAVRVAEDFRSVRGEVSLFRDLFGDRDLRLAGLGVAFFWFAAALTGAILILAARELAGPGSAALVHATRFTAAAGTGVILGAWCVVRYCRRGLELDLVPAAALGLAGSFLAAVLCRAASPGFVIAMTCLGLSGGLFVVSLHVFLQKKAGPAYHQMVLPAVRLLAGLAQILALALEWLLRAVHLPAQFHFVILGLLASGAVAFVARILPRHFLRFFCNVLVRAIYRVHRLHPEHVPREGGVLMISNHVSYVDAFLLSVASPRPVRFVIVEHFLRVPAFGWFLRLFDVIPISSTRAKDAIRTTAEALRQGDLVCIFPEGQLTRTGMLNELKKGFELIVRQARCPVLPVYMDSVWGSIFSFERFRYFFKLPRRIPYPVTVNFGHPVPPEEIDSVRARVLIQDLSVEAFAWREELRASLGAAAIRGLRRHGVLDLFVDLGPDLRNLSHREVLSISMALATVWRRRLPGDQRRLGILLPAGSMPALLHLAAVLSGRVPVHLPLSMLSDAARDHFLTRHEIRAVISSRMLFPDDGLPPGWMDLREAISGLGFVPKLLARLSQWFLPSWAAIRFFNLHRLDRDGEAVAYADESTGQLISLSHRNLIAAVHQIDSTLALLPEERILIDSGFTSMPALLFGLWHPCLKGNTALFRSLRTRKVDPVLLLQDQEPEAVLLSPELGRQILASAESLPGSIRVFLDFSSPPQQAAELTSRLESAGAVHCVGFAPRGLGAIVSMNTVDPNSMIPHHLPQTGNLPGTVGRLMPGLSARLVSPAGTPLESGDGEGLLAVRGSSIPGEPDLSVEGIPHHGLGIAARFDRQGFLFVRGTE